VNFIMEADSQRVQELLRGREAFAPEGAHRRSLVGFVNCVACGSPLVLQSTPGGCRYYRCRNARLRVSDEGFCSERSIRADVLEDVVRKVVPGFVSDHETDAVSPGGES